MKLKEISKGSGELSQEALRNLAVAEFMAACPLANYLEFYSISGNADNPRKADSDMTAGATRTIGSDYTAKTNTPSFASVALKIYGDKVATDIAYERRGIDIGSQRARDLANAARSIGRFFTDKLINDTLAAETFSGLKEQTTNLNRYAIFDTANGGQVNPGNNFADVKQQHKFLEFLDANIQDIQGGPDVIICNGTFIARLTSIARAYISILNVQDIYGNNQNITTYNGIPLINAGYASNGSSLVLPFNEEEGSSSDCSSVYLVKFGEAEDVSLATNVGMDVKDMGVQGTSYLTLIEFDVDLVVLNAKAVKRLRGLRLNTLS